MRAIKELFRKLFNYRVRALIQKEFRQIRRDRRLAISLILPPTCSCSYSALRSVPQCPMSAWAWSTTAGRPKAAN